MSIIDTIWRLDPFYPVVDSVDWVERLVKQGTKLVQLRIKDRDDETVVPEIRAALAVCRAYGADLVVNDYWQAAIAAGADFLHLGQGDLDSADLAAIRAAGLKLGISTHDHAELARALACDPDYVALGPIYPTTLKVMPFAPQGLERISEWKKLIGTLPLVAIGGITLERAPACLAAGADVTAMVSDVTRDPDPDARIQAWLAATRPASVGA
ncbi:thiamine phosphate synthase [Labrys sp. KNU-23]|uniref:thiamine phosphate synthase n=1 Tax=Labrys sp. KNU-23 TaxID=2789216 RepID=UPI0011ECBEE0|nr:thiamine phosphate synthase [Labrys sp. KNU-23]QEN89075.1 thiamine phosphate synthase [Labrys sp. KNU-23]